MIPEENKGQDIYIQHYTRYLFSSQFAKNAVVLDIACGSGYGSKILRDAGAEMVYGVDISEETVNYCKEKYIDSQMNFAVGSVEKIPIEDASVDLVVSFETIEHVDANAQINFLKEVKRVLKPGGKFIVSTPNLLVYPKGNEFHLKELNPVEFEDVLAGYFKNAKVYYQDDVECSYLFSEDNFKKNGSGKRNSIVEMIENILPKESMYLVALCSDHDLCNANEYVGLSNMKPFEAHKKYLEEIRRRDLQLQQKEKQLQQKEEQLSKVVNSLRWKIPNLFYKQYEKRIKKHIPKRFFLFTNKFIDAYHIIRDSVVIRAGREYFNLSRMIWKEFFLNGIEGVTFVVKRHLRIKNEKNTIPYPIAKDYEEGLVSIGILTKDRPDLIRPCIESIEKYLSKKYKVEILIGDTGSVEKNTWKFYQTARKKYQNIRIIKFKKYFFSQNYNDLFNREASGQYLIFLNNDTVVKEEWLDNLINPLENKKAGIVGGKLLYKDGNIQHAGIIFKENGNAFHEHTKEKSDIADANYPAIVPAVTFACVAVRHDVFDRFQLSEDFEEEAQDTDFCLRLAEGGFDVLYDPKVEIYHFEGSMRDWKKGKKDRALFRERWSGKIKEIVGKNNQRIPLKSDAYDGAIVVVRDDGIGDLLMGVSAFANLRKKHPDKKLVLLTYERNIEMMDGFGIFDEILPIPNGRKYSPLPLPTEGTKIYNMIDIEMHFGPVYGITKEANKVSRHLSFAKALEVGTEFNLEKMPDYPEAKKEVSKLLAEAGAKENDRFVVFNLSSTNPARSWWEPYYPKLIEAVEKMGFVPLIVGTKDGEYAKGDKMINLIGKTKTIAEYIEAVKLGTYVISTDTSAYHIAALSDTPFLAIFTGGILPEARLSYYSKYEVAQPPKTLACYPCWDEGCKDMCVRWKKDPCRIMIKPKEVIEKFQKLVSNYPQG